MEASWLCVSSIMTLSSASALVAHALVRPMILKCATAKPRPSSKGLALKSRLRLFKLLQLPLRPYASLWASRLLRALVLSCLLHAGESLHTRPSALSQNHPFEYP